MSWTSRILICWSMAVATSDKTWYISILCVVLMGAGIEMALEDED